YYVKEMERQICDPLFYRPITVDVCFVQMIDTKIRSLVENNEMFSKKLKKFVFSNMGKFYPCVPHLMPKVHKLEKKNNNDISSSPLDVLQCRLIISCIKYRTTPLSKWIDAILKPLLNFIPTVVKDSKNFICMLEKFSVPEELRK